MASINVSQQPAAVVRVSGNSVPVISVSNPDVNVVKIETGGPAGPAGPTGPTGPAGPAGTGVPAGGEYHQVLAKASDTDYDVEWVPARITQRVKNVSGGELAKGTPVAVGPAGPSGNVVDVIAARSDTASAMPAMFVLNETLADEAEGEGIVSGYISGVNTNDFDPGDTVYVGATGGYTNVKPTGTNLIQNLGVVIKKHPSNGSGMIYGSGRSNDVPNLPDGKLFIGSATNTTESAYTIPTSIGTDGQVLQSDGTNVVFGRGGVTIFDTVADLTGAGLADGDLVRTAGYLSYGDGGGLKYEINTSSTGETGTVVDIGGGLYAHALLPTVLNPIMFGAKVDDDTVATANTTALNNMFSYMGSLIGTDNSSIACEFVAGTIHINGEVKMPVGSGATTIVDATFVIDFNGAKVIGEDTGTPYTMFSRKKTDLDVARYGSIQNSTGEDYLQHRYIVKNGIIVGPNRDDGTNLMQIQCTYGTHVSNMKFSIAHTALSMQFCLLSLLEQNLYSSCDYGSILSSGTDYASHSVDGWTGGTINGTQCNASTIRQERHYCTSTSGAAISVLSASGCRVEQCVVEGTETDYAVYFDSQGGTTVKDFLIDNLWIEVLSNVTTAGVKKAGIYLSPIGGLVTVKGVFSQHQYTVFNSDKNSFTQTSSGTQGTYTLVQSSGDLTTSGSGTGLTLVVEVNSGGTIESWRLGGNAGDTSGFVDGEVITIPAGKLGGSSTEATITVKARDLYESGDTDGAVGEIKAGVPLIDTSQNTSNPTYDLGTSFWRVGHKIKGGAATYIFDGVDGGPGGYPDDIIVIGTGSTDIPVNDPYWLAYYDTSESSLATYPENRSGKVIEATGDVYDLASVDSVRYVLASKASIGSVSSVDASVVTQVEAASQTIKNILPSGGEFSININSSDEFKVGATKTQILNQLQINDNTNGYRFPINQGSQNQILVAGDPDASAPFLSFEDLNISLDTSPQLGGDLDVNGNAIKGSTVSILGATGELMITATENGPVALRYDNNLKLSTKSDGVDITGELQADSLDIDGNADISGTLNTHTIPSGTGTIALTSDIPTSGVDFDPVGTDNSTDVTLSGSYDYLTLSGQQITLGQIDYSTDISNTPSLLDASGTPANNQLAVWVDADTLEGDTSLTWTGTKLSVGGELATDAILVDEADISSAGDFGAGSRLLSRIGANTSVTVGDVYYLGSTWAQADADAVSTASGLIGVAVYSSTNNGVLVSGAVKVADNTGFSSSTEGTVLYLDTTAGHVTATAPSATGDVVRVVGYVLDGSNGIIYFDPSKDWIELS
jgi:hypothetical protein